MIDDGVYTRLGSSLPVYTFHMVLDDGQPESITDEKAVALVREVATIEVTALAVQGGSYGVSGGVVNGCLGACGRHFFPVWSVATADIGE